ncbi:MAG TPA: HDOD domain-containing protein [Bryobacteraceae bacterium]|nr:HDOD domain-containing protein [Bryobacteraceae bacterium]
MAERSVTVSGALEKIPAFPPIAVRVLQLTSDEGVPIVQLEKAIMLDPVLSTEVLRRANSALFNLTSEVTTLKHALIILGLDRIKSISTTIAASRYLKSTLIVDELRACWRASIARAVIGQMLARYFLLQEDEAYIAGLLKDLGRLGLMTAYPPEYTHLLSMAAASVHAEAVDIREAEIQMFSIDSASAGIYLAGKWGLPDYIQSVLSEEPGAENASNLARLVHLASRLAEALGFGLIPGAASADFETVLAEIPEYVRNRIPRNADLFRREVEARLESFDPNVKPAPMATTPLVSSPGERALKDRSSDEAVFSNTVAPLEPEHERVWIWILCCGVLTTVFTLLFMMLLRR